MIIKRKLRLCFLLILVLFAAGVMITKGAYATVYTWNGGGDGTTWEDGNNWNPNAPAGGPVAGDSATIDLAAANVTIAGTTTVSKLTIGGTNTSTLTLGGNDLNVTYVDATYNGDLTIGTNGTLDASTVTPIITVEGNWDSSAGTFTYGTSTVVMTGSSNNFTTSTGFQVRNLTIGVGANITATESFSFPIGGTFIISDSGTFNIASGKTTGYQNMLTMNDNATLGGAGGTFNQTIMGSYTGNTFGSNITISVGDYNIDTVWGTDTSPGKPINGVTYGGNLSIATIEQRKSNVLFKT